MNFELTAFNINRKDWIKIPKEEQVFLVQISSLLNEILTLQRFIILSNNQIDKYDEVQRTAQVFQSLFIIRILAGLLFEGWNYLSENYFGKNLEKKHKKELPCKGRKILNRLKRNFNVSRLKEIRNCHAFHYDNSTISNAVNHISENEVFGVLSSKKHRSVFIPSAGSIMNWHLLESIDKDMKKAMKKLINEVIETASANFIDFGECIIALYLNRSDYEEFDLCLKDVDSSKMLKLPFFMRK
jgi:hypothetical protein